METIDETLLKAQDAQQQDAPPPLQTLDADDAADKQLQQQHQHQTLLAVHQDAHLKGSMASSAVTPVLVSSLPAAFQGATGAMPPALIPVSAIGLPHMSSMSTVTTSSAVLNAGNIVTISPQDANLIPHHQLQYTQLLQQATPVQEAHILQPQQQQQQQHTSPGSKAGKGE
jgi:hypothetical protein